MNPIQLTEAAQAYFCELLDMTGQKAILLSVNSKGCGGHGYQLNFVDREFGGDALDLGADRRLIIDHKSLLWLMGTQIDYIDSGLEQRVVFINPMESGRCGCGMSFTCSR